MSQEDVLKVFKAKKKRVLSVSEIQKFLQKENRDVKRMNVLVWVNKLQNWGIVDKFKKEKEIYVVLNNK